MSDKLKLQGVFSQGYGIIPKAIMKDKDLTIEAKAIYSYLASYAGAGNTAFPSISLMISDLCIGEERFYKHRKLLVEKGYLIIEEGKKEKGKFHKNVYVLNNSPYPQNKGTDSPCTDKPSTDYPCTDEPTTDNKGTNNNSSNNNSINNNSNKKERRNSSKLKYDDTHMELATLLWGHVKENFPNAKDPNLESWANDIRLMMERDNRTIAEIKGVIEWSQNHDFWYANIRSAEKLRAQYDEMYAQADREKKQAKPKPRKIIQKETTPYWAKNNKDVDKPVNKTENPADDTRPDERSKAIQERLERMEQLRKERGL